MQVKAAQGSIGIAIEHLLVNVPVGKERVEGTLSVPTDATGVVVFAHGSGSTHRSPRNRFVADILNEGRLATLLIDLLTPDEQQVDLQTMHLRFDIPFLAHRLTRISDWVDLYPDVRRLPVGLFGASTGAAAALVTAAERPDMVRAVVSRGGRPDLANDALPKVQAPTLLIVGGDDVPVIELNRRAMTRMRGNCKLEIVPGATHLFEERGALGRVAVLARDWFGEWLRPAQQLEV